MTPSKKTITYSSSSDPTMAWSGPGETIVHEGEAVRKKLLDTARPCFIVQQDEGAGITSDGNPVPDGFGGASGQLLAYSGAIRAEDLGDAGFREFYDTRYACYGGSMAHAISSVDMVIALGKNGLLGSFGAGGVVPPKLEEAIQRIKQELPNGPYAFNLIHNPFQEAMERKAVDLYLKHGIRTVEASAYMDLTPYVVYYRVAGLEQGQDGRVKINNRILAKVSRREVGQKFMEPAPEKILLQLKEQNLVSQEQVNMARTVPMADDVTVEADSGGHTDNRPLVSILPSMLALRDEIQNRYNYESPVRIGAAGGIGTPESALAAFMMGAAYVVTGSVNQSCIEAGTSPQVQKLLAQAGVADVTMAPAFDMFEMGGKLQVLKRGTLFAMRAQKLTELYRAYNSIEEIPAEEREKIEKQLFRKPLEQIWQETVDYFNQRDPEQIHKANSNPRKKMALVFRWYLGLASQWANYGEAGREMDYQIWCGPSMGAFNDWVRGSYLEKPENRNVAEVTRHILSGAAYLFRLQHLKLQGVTFPASFSRYLPEKNV